MKLSKEAKKIAKNLNLSKADAVIMELKSKLYEKAATTIKQSELTHQEVADKVGTSRARISRISNMGENSISIELLVKIIFTLENKMPIKYFSA